MKNLIYLALIAFVVSGCATSRTTGEQAEKSKLTPGMVKQHIIKGQTTQNELISLFGSPNIITNDKNGNEVWTYSKQSSSADSGSKGFGWSALVIGGSNASAYSNTSTNTFDLVITFTKNNIVKDYSVVSSKF